MARSLAPEAHRENVVVLLFITSAIVAGAATSGVAMVHVTGGKGPVLVLFTALTALCAMRWGVATGLYMAVASAASLNLFFFGDPLEFQPPTRSEIAIGVLMFGVGWLFGRLKPTAQSAGRIDASPMEYLADISAGRHHGDNLADQIIETSAPELLPYTVEMMMQRKIWTGYEIGFFNQISRRLMGFPRDNAYDFETQRVVAQAENKVGAALIRDEQPRRDELPKQ